MHKRPGKGLHRGLTGSTGMVHPSYLWTMRRPLRQGVGSWERHPHACSNPMLIRYFLSVQFSQTICPHKSYGQMPTTLGHFHGVFQPFLVMHHNHNIPADVHQLCAPREHQRCEYPSGTSKETIMAIRRNSSTMPTALWPCT